MTYSVIPQQADVDSITIEKNEKSELQISNNILNKIAENQIRTIYLEALESLDFKDFDFGQVDIFTTANGYGNSVNISDTTAQFNTDKYDLFSVDLTDPSGYSQTSGTLTSSSLTLDFTAKDGVDDFILSSSNHAINNSQGLSRDYNVQLEIDNEILLNKSVTSSVNGSININYTFDDFTRPIKANETGTIVISCSNVVLERTNSGVNSWDTTYATISAPGNRPKGTNLLTFSKVNITNEELVINLENSTNKIHISSNQNLNNVFVKLDSMEHQLNPNEINTIPFIPTELILKNNDGETISIKEYVLFFW